MRATVQKMRSMRERRQNNLKREKKKKASKFTTHSRTDTYTWGSLWQREKAASTKKDYVQLRPTAAARKEFKISPYKKDKES